MIKSIIKYIILNLSIIFLVTCTPEDILEELTGQEVLWLCPDSNAAYDDASFCNSLEEIVLEVFLVEVLFLSVFVFAMFSKILAHLLPFFK